MSFVFIYNNGMLCNISVEKQYQLWINMRFGILELQNRVTETRSHFELLTRKFLEKFFFRVTRLFETKFQLELLTRRLTFIFPLSSY